MFRKFITVLVATYLIVGCSILISYKSNDVKMNKSPNIGNDDKLPVDMDMHKDRLYVVDTIKVK